MFWLLDHYVLHALAVLFCIAWGVRLERKDRATKASLRTLVKMIDRDLDELRDERDGQMLRVTVILLDIRDGLAELLDSKRGGK